MSWFVPTWADLPHILGTIVVLLAIGKYRDQFRAVTSITIAQSPRYEVKTVTSKWDGFALIMMAYITYDVVYYLAAKSILLVFALMPLFFPSL